MYIEVDFFWKWSKFLEKNWKKVNLKKEIKPISKKKLKIYFT
jgi:hypothetical protein